ncbi:Maf family protein [Psychrobacter sp. I-STPA10]|uniref:Maf family protein n=1 Tax=Psychrobacter sp. I-STPA10 TaxID=2585769 RepID=UPI001E4AB781|nr:Maf family protein [Psychrobacter sp. I-STPA10]
MLPIFLASSSPRRKELLITAGINFSTLSVDIDESIAVGELPTDYIARMATQKAQAAMNKIATTIPVNDVYIIITADTIGVLADGTTILVKPNDQQHAMQMWQAMSNSTHEVWTAVCISLVKPNQSQHNLIKSEQILEKTQVNFIALTKQMMQDYWHTGEPQDKAGGYAIQGRAAAWVKSINGSYTNVVGLPLAQTLQVLNAMQSIDYS